MRSNREKALSEFNIMMEKAGALKSGMLCLLGELVIIVYYFNKSHTILSRPAPIWYNDSLNIQSYAAVK